jgi:hypothetical protein
MLGALFLQDVTLINLNDDYPGFVANITEADIDSITHVAETELNPALLTPRDQTIQRIDAAGKQLDYFPQASESKK